MTYIHSSIDVLPDCSIIVAGAAVNVATLLDNAHDLMMTSAPSNPLKASDAVSTVPWFLLAAVISSCTALFIHLP